ncbi:MAG: hypothetical protein KAW93_04975 [Methanogenium sp.]|nr:hypothetical protein [Methanogenium sp.]
MKEYICVFVKYIIYQMNSDSQESAISEIVGFILIFAIMMVVLSLYVVYVVPAEGRENEIRHMGVINERFIDYKSSLDSLWINGFNRNAESPGNYTTYGVTQSTAFNLGTGPGLAGGGIFSPLLLTPANSGGSFTVNSRDESITINTSYFVNPVSFNMGDLTYQSDNLYWISQSYYYQMGGVFLSQDSGSSARVFPLLSIYQIFPEGATEPAPKIKLTVVNITGNQNIGGRGPVRIESRMKEAVAEDFYRELTFVKLTVDVKDEQTGDMWKRIFRDALAAGSINESWYTTGENSPTSVWLKVTGNSSKVDFDLIRIGYDCNLQTVATLIT